MTCRKGRILDRTCHDFDIDTDLTASSTCGKTYVCIGCGGRAGGMICKDTHTRVCVRARTHTYTHTHTHTHTPHTHTSVRRGVLAVSSAQPRACREVSGSRSSNAAKSGGNSTCGKEGIYVSMFVHTYTYIHTYK